jgi:hypothetical protein
MRSSLPSPSSGRAVAASLMLVAALVAGAALATGTIARADAPRRQARDTHIGQRLDDFVVLNLINATTTPIFVRCHDDGTRDTTEFTVPTGYRLVVTDSDYVAQGSGAVFATLRLFVEKSSNRCLVALQSNVSNFANSSSGSNYTTWGSSGIVAGFVVGSGARVVADLQNVTAVPGAGTTIASFAGGNAAVVLRGYLVKDE